MYCESGGDIDNVHWLLEQDPEFSLDDISERLCPELRDKRVGEGMHPAPSGCT